MDLSCCGAPRTFRAIDHLQLHAHTSATCVCTIARLCMVRHDVMCNAARSVHTRATSFCVISLPFLARHFSHFSKKKIDFPTKPPLIFQNFSADADLETSRIPPSRWPHVISCFIKTYTVEKMIFFVFEHFSEKVRSFEPPRRADSESGTVECVAQTFMRKFAIEIHFLCMKNLKICSCS